jgi:hypothetical protein
MFTCAQPHERPTQQISFSLRLTGESFGVSHHLNSLHRGDQYIVSSPSQRERHTQLMGFPTQGHTTFHLCLREEPHTQLMGFPTQGHTTFLLHLREEPHTHLMGTPNTWASSPHTGAHNVPSPVSERNNTPISWAHPTHGLSLRPTHSVYVLEDVSCSCNHQQYPIFNIDMHLYKYPNYTRSNDYLYFIEICVQQQKYIINPSSKKEIV